MGRGLRIPELDLQELISTDKAYYLDKDLQPGEDDIRKLCKTVLKEDAWWFYTDQKRWVHMPQKYENQVTTNQVQLTYVESVLTHEQESFEHSNYIDYHTHPNENARNRFRNYLQSHPSTSESVQNLFKIAMHCYLAVPSTHDMNAYMQLKKEDQHFTEGRIVTTLGTTIVQIENESTQWNPLSEDELLSAVLTDQERIEAVLYEGASLHPITNDLIELINDKNKEYARISLVPAP